MTSIMLTNGHVTTNHTCGKRVASPYKWKYNANLKILMEKTSVEKASQVTCIRVNTIPLIQTQLNTSAPEVF